MESEPLCSDISSSPPPPPSFYLPLVSNCSSTTPNVLIQVKLHIYMHNV